MKVRNYIQRAEIMSKGGKFVTDTKRHQNRKCRQNSKLNLKQRLNTKY